MMEERNGGTQYSLRGLRAFVAQGPLEDEFLFHQDDCTLGRQIFAWVGIFSHGCLSFERLSPFLQTIDQLEVTDKFLAFV